MPYLWVHTHSAMGLLQARECMYKAEEVKRSKAVTAARTHASELEAAVARSDAEAAAGTFQQFKNNVNSLLMELKYVPPLVVFVLIAQS